METTNQFFRFHLLVSTDSTDRPGSGKAAGLSAMLLDLGHKVMCYDSGSDDTPLAINAQKRPSDFLLVTDVRQKPIADAVNLWLTLEPCVDYLNSFAPFRAFESAYWRNFTYGLENSYRSHDIAYHDRVIPRSYNSRDYQFTNIPDDYFLYIGNNPQTAIVATNAANGRLRIAGQGGATLSLEERMYLISKAKAVFVPSTAQGDAPWLVAEAGLCGTPAITGDFGVFPEIVVDQVTGYRCNMLQDFVNAARWVNQIDRTAVRHHALRFTVGNVKYRFRQWFMDLHQLYRSAHEPGVKGWNHYE